jgi:MtN3 and saliva related transmembrane protein
MGLRIVQTPRRCHQHLTWRPLRFALIRADLRRGCSIGSQATETNVTVSAPMELVGALAAVLTTVCWVPQAIKIVRERETRAISLPGTTLCVVGVLLWLIYGLALSDAPLIGSSTATLAITAAILVLKIRHG